MIILNETYKDMPYNFFEKLDINGQKLPDGSGYFDGVRVIHDTNTGLYWEVKSPDESSINYCKDKYSFEEANTVYAEKLNDNCYSGYSDWRIPNKDELRSIIDYSLDDIAIDGNIFENCQAGDYWTCNVYGMQPYFSWVIYFGFGSGIAKNKESAHYVIACRGGKDRRFGASESSRFVINGDGTVTDLSTGLMWQQGENPRMNVFEAENQCSQMTLAGYTDWRLPNIKELNTILNLDFTDNQWYFKSAFPAEGLEPPLLHYFSRSSFKGHYAWVTNFCFGYDGYYGGKNAPLLFRAVRYAEPFCEDELTAKHEYNIPHTGELTLYDVEGKPLSEAGEYQGCDSTRIICPMKFKTISGKKAVYDENTGLTWQKESDKRYSWYEAQDYIMMLNKERFCGFSDWRLPFREELRSIVNYNGSIPAVDTDIFQNTAAELFWSAEEHKQDRNLAWGIYFGYGCCIGYPKTSSCMVRAVRGGAAGIFDSDISKRFSINNDGTVTDNKLGLMWMQDETPMLTLTEALSYCRELRLAGYDDWALPNIKELGTLINLLPDENEWYYKDLFPKTNTKPQGFYMASTTFDATFGWGCNFQFGFDGYYADRKNGHYPFRPVRRIR